MKKIIVFVLTAGILASCGTKFSLQKRKYNKGFYVSFFHRHKKADKPSGISVNITKQEAEKIPVEIVSEKKNENNSPGNTDYISASGDSGNGMIIQKPKINFFQHQKTELKKKMETVAQSDLKKKIEIKIKKVIPHPLQALSFLFTAIIFFLAAGVCYLFYNGTLGLPSGKTESDFLTYGIIAGVLGVIFIIMAIKKLL